MKHLYILLFFTLSFISFQAQSQSSLIHNLTVMAKGGGYESNLDIVLVESTSFKMKKYKTNAVGKLTIALDSGSVWVMHIGEMKAHTILRLKKGMKGTSNQLLTYDLEKWERNNKTPEDRSDLALNYVSKRPKMNEISDRNQAIVTVNLKTPSKKLAQVFLLIFSVMLI